MSGSQTENPPGPDTDDTTQCTHIASALANPATRAAMLAKYKSVIAWNVYRLHGLRQAAVPRSFQLSSPTCGTCGLALPRPLVCLHCAYAGCWTLISKHALGHLKEAAHLFCVDVKSGSIFCAECNDFIYDPTVDELHLSTVINAEEKQTHFQSSKKPREPFKSWVPSAQETAAIESAVTVPCQGRRGLLNLGQTCFLNVVLQCFLHNPLLRNYFLSDKHNHKLCKVKDCTCCEMDKLFAEVYSGDTTPYGPVNFLATTWRASSELSGYAQQDAHEFFIATLNHIHTTSRGSTNVSCNCIIHTTFAGQLQSDVKCDRCSNVTTTVDPMLDISLELKGKGGEIVHGENTLAGCLRRFTLPEALGPKEYTCAKCGKGSHEASKRLSIRKLPPVLSFQFKRFEHKSSDKSSARKMDTQIRIPASLNMMLFTTLAMSLKEKGSENSAHILASLGPEVMYEYDLFAVINHEGQIDNGHYTNFARCRDEWYRFDDDKVTLSSLGACLNSPAYMCFYIKRHLDYKPYMIPSYVLTRETEAVKEKELEKVKQAARDKELEDAILATV